MTKYSGKTKKYDQDQDNQQDQVLFQDQELVNTEKQVSCTLHDKSMRTNIH